jgi:hypothetical protein
MLCCILTSSCPFHHHPDLHACAWHSFEDFNDMIQWWAHRIELREVSTILDEGVFPLQEEDPASVTLIFPKCRRKTHLCPINLYFLS